MSNLRCELIDAGLLIDTGIDGVIGRGARFEDVLTRLASVVERWEQEAGAERVHFPPVMNRAHVERNGYLKSFPHLATALHGFTCDDRGHAIGEDLATGLMLVPSACYPIYPMLAQRDPLPPGGALFHVHSWCFRREPSTDAPRLQSFRMFEYVQIGTEPDVLAARERWIGQAEKLVAALQLPYRIDVANDPFFGRAGRLVASSQRERNLKFELLIPITDGAEPTACCSFNYAEDHFTAVWNIRMRDGAKACSGCIGFGMERMTMALFRHHGLDPDRWPDGVRSVLGLP